MTKPVNLSIKLINGLNCKIQHDLMCLPQFTITRIQVTLRDKLVYPMIRLQVLDKSVRADLNPGKSCARIS